MFYRNGAPPRKQRIIASTLACGLLLSALGIVTTTAASAQDQLTPQDITTSTNASAAPYLADGDHGTMWASTTGAGDITPWIQYDLGAAHAIDSVKAYWEGAYSTRYIITGWDGEQWLPLKRVTPTAAGNPDTITDLAHTDKKFRHVGLAVEGRFNADWGVKLYELEVFGTAAEPSTQDAPTTTPHDYLGAPRIPDGATNLALDKHAIGSSALSPATNAIDGDLTTRWQAAQNDAGETLTIDLQGTADISAVTLDPEAAFARAFTVETSVNGWNDWQEFAAVEGAQAEHTIVVSDLGAVTARYVRITTVTRATPYGTSFYEVGVWGDASSYSAAAPEKGEGQGVGQLLSYGKPVEAANAEGGHVGSHVVDGDLSTRWSTDPGQTWQVRDTWDGTAWLAIDLGATPDAINQISMRWNPAYAASYSLHVADGATLPAVDDPAWREIYATTAGSGKRDTVNLPDPSITGRWVLIKMLREGPAGDGNFYGYSLFEVRVYGDAGPQFPINTPPANPNDDATNPDFNNLVTVWEDTFDGAAGTLPDPSRWTIDPAPAGQNNAELQSYTSSTDNIALDGDGNLVITAIKNSDGSYTSGRLNTSRKAHVQYGRVEARAKIPAGQGLWPAFWLMGENFLDGTEWPTNGEIDVMEVLGHDTETLHNTIHGPGYSGMGGVGGAFDATVDLSQDFHTYGFDWDRDGLRFWLDSPEQITRTIPISRVEDELGFPWVYDQPFFMILNLAVGGDWPGSPNANTEFPAQLIVDHVRVQQSEGSGQLRTEDFTADPRVVDIAVDAPTTLVYGERPTLNITATSGRTTTPSGDLTVAIGEESDVIRLNRGAASYRLPTLPVGEHTITLSYADPSGGLYDATRTFTVTVQAADSALLVDLGGETVAEIEPVVAVVRFAAAPGVFPTGKVRVEVDGDVSGEVTLVPEDNGVAVLRLPARTTVGSRTVTVSYEGDANNAAQTVELTHSSRELPPCPAVPGDSSGTDSGAESGADSGGDTTTDGTSSGIGSGTGDGVLGDQVATGSNSTDSKEATSGDSTQSGGLAKAGFGQPYLAVLAAAIIGGGYLLVRQTRRVPLPTS